MEIYVKKDDIKATLEKCVHEVIEMAKQNASQGITRFWYCKSNYRDRGVSSHEILQHVEHLTNNTVYGGYRSVTSEGIKFSIREK